MFRKMLFIVIPDIEVPVLLLDQKVHHTFDILAINWKELLVDFINPEGIFDVGQFKGAIPGADGKHIGIHEAVHGAFPQGKPGLIKVIRNGHNVPDDG
jgi:hypothetical protein